MKAKAKGPQAWQRDVDEVRLDDLPIAGGMVIRVDDLLDSGMTGALYRQSEQP